MRSLYVIAVGVVIMATLYIPWTVLVYSALRLCGIPVEVWPGKGRVATNDIVLRKLGKLRFVFVEGVLLWGVPLFIGFDIAHYLAHRYLGGQFDSRQLIGDLLLWSVLGSCFGLRTWSKSSRWDFELDS